MDDLAPRLRQLATELDRLEAAVEPLLLHNHQATASLRLPLLDRAKLQVLASYALESALFCSLGLSGLDARQHAVFRELQRVRQYMQKIDSVENKKADGSEEKGPTARLDKAAAIRFLRADMDDPDVRARLSQLGKENDKKTAAAAAAAPSHAPRGRKRGGAATGDRRETHDGGSGSGSNLAKRPKRGRPA